MPLETEIVERTGIFQEVRVRPVRMDRESVGELFEGINRQFDVEGRLTAMEQHALRILSNYKGKKLVGRDPVTNNLIFEEVSSAEWPYYQAENAPPIARDAHRVLDGVRCVRDARAKNHIQYAIAHTMTLQTAYERLIIRPFEPYVAKGRKVVEGGRKGHVRKYGTQQEKFERYAKYQFTMDALRTEEPGLSYHRACDRVARVHRCSPTTIKRHTQNKKKK